MFHSDVGAKKYIFGLYTDNKVHPNYNLTKLYVYIHISNDVDQYRHFFSE